MKRARKTTRQAPATEPESLLEDVNEMEAVEMIANTTGTDGRLSDLSLELRWQVFTPSGRPTEPKRFLTIGTKGSTFEVDNHTDSGTFCAYVDPSNARAVRALGEALVGFAARVERFEMARARAASRA